MLKDSSPLIVLEVANSHSGNLEHGLKIINEISEVTRNFPFKFAIKFQYRDIDTFIHPDYKGDYSFKYVKRFSETRLKEEDLLTLKTEAQRLGFITICTPFDENSVDLIEKHNYSIIKIASCSFTDWPLLERIVKTDKPIIASTAGTSMKDIENFVSFMEHRNKDFALLHCVAQYPTPDKYLSLDRIKLLKDKFPNIPIGYSTHENPDGYESIKVAIGLGATIFEKHVAIHTDEIMPNAYSAIPEQVGNWLQSALHAYEMLQVSETSIRELSELKALQRGAYCKRKIKVGEQIKVEDVLFAIPVVDESQFVANDFSKYVEFKARMDIPELYPLTREYIEFIDKRNGVSTIVHKVNDFIKNSGLSVPHKVDIEISHHYGMEFFDLYGMTIFTVINDEYCKKLLVLLPNQQHPAQYHKKKTETFHILAGEVFITLNGCKQKYVKDDIVTVNIGVKHTMETLTGVVIEEISSTHYKDDSFYVDEKINSNPNRKTKLTYWLE